MYTINFPSILMFKETSKLHYQEMDQCVNCVLIDKEFQVSIEI